MKEQDNDTRPLRAMRESYRFAVALADELGWDDAPAEEWEAFLMGAEAAYERCSEAQARL